MYKPSIKEATSMARLRVEWVTEEGWEDAYEIFYRALKKLMNEGKERFFAGMTPEGTKKATRDGNVLYLVYRSNDPMPVAAIAFIREKSYKDYRKLLKGVPEEKVATFNAIAVRPELWGQGYARQCMKLCVNHLRFTGVNTLVGTVHPDNVASIKTMKYVSTTGSLKMSDPYTWVTPNGRILERRRFAFQI